MILKPDYTSFINVLNTRGIEHLIHFTPTINLLSIFEQNKILSRSTLEKLDILETDVLDYAEFTDEIRYDDKNYINLSVSHPNSFLLNKFISKTNSKIHVCWCVLKINPKYVYYDSTLFSVTNAANSNNKRVYGISGDLKKFEMMFTDKLTVTSFSGTRVLSRINLKPKYTTDVQAEVLIRDEISYSDVLFVCFKTHTDLAATKAALSEYDTSNFIVDESIFKSERL